MHFPPTVWGPFFWHTIHITALGYSDNPTYTEKRAAKEFYESLQVLIPCPICRDHYISHMAKSPIGPSLDSKKDLFRWTVQLHNEVNEMLKKRKYSETEVIQYYTRLGARGKSPVISGNDFVESDYQAMLKGIGIGVSITAILGGILYFNLPNSK